MEEMVATLKESEFSDYKLPSMKLTSAFGTFIVRQMARFQKPGARSFLETNLGQSLQLDNSKIRNDLGLEFGDVTSSIVDTANNLASWGHIPEKR